jgi:murein DD-endopeptidase MepM/ murein hydrolase activator NlpD
MDRRLLLSWERTMPPDVDPSPVIATPSPEPSKLIYPLPRPPVASYRTGGRHFGATRSGGRRKHAACDLLAPVNTPVRAIADGRVIRASYYFYENTNAIEVHHPGIGVVRYGELSMKKIVPLRAGDRVAVGDLVGYVGLLSYGASMLHFELYSGKASGDLTNGSSPFQRRSDLLNPSDLIDKLYRLTFG